MAASQETPSKRAEASPVPVGERVAGRYRVERILAGGGMGVVVAARHEALDTPVAIKFLRAAALTDAMAARFLREARAAASLGSPFVTRVFDYGTLEGGMPYMVMELLVGNDLAQELKGRGPMPVEEAVDIVLMALAGIAEAHARGIVHRDLKPSNLFLVEALPGVARQLKVLDFGISKVVESVPVEDDLTSTTAILGSPRYMSPEQAECSKTVDVRTDIWSLGVILFQMLSGAPPFRGDTMGEILTRVLAGKPPKLGAARPDLPAGLEAVVMRCLERDRERRFSSAAEVAQALLPFGSSRAVAWVEPLRAGAPPALVASSAAVPAAEPQTADRAPAGTAEIVSSPSTGAILASVEPSYAAPGPPRSRSRGAFVAALAAALAIGAGIAWTARSERGRPVDAAPATTSPPETAAPVAAAPPPTAAPSAPPSDTTSPAPPGASAARPALARPTTPAKPPPTHRPKPDLLERSD